MQDRGTQSWAFRGTQRGNGRRPLDVKDALVLFIGLITVSTVCGECGMLFAVTELISIVIELLG